MVINDDSVALRGGGTVSRGWWISATLEKENISESLPVAESVCGDSNVGSTVSVSE